jgi:hypothetical protein
MQRAERKKLQSDGCAVQPHPEDFIMWSKKIQQQMPEQLGATGEM